MHALVCMSDSACRCGIVACCLRMFRIFVEPKQKRFASPAQNPLAPCLLLMQRRELSILKMHLVSALSCRMTRLLCFQAALEFWHYRQTAVVIKVWHAYVARKSDLQARRRLLMSWTQDCTLRKAFISWVAWTHVSAGKQECMWQVWGTLPNVCRPVCYLQTLVESAPLRRSQLASCGSISAHAATVLALTLRALTA